MRWLYNALFTFVFCLSAPFRLWGLWRKDKRGEGRAQRIGRYSSKLKQTITNRQMIWLHVASSEGVNACTQLIRGIKMHAPNLTVVVSTSKSTCMATLEEKLPTQILKIYSPLDRHRYMQRAFSVLQPYAVVLVGVEIRPNLLWKAYKRRVPVFLVSLQLDQSKRYQVFPTLFKPLFALLTGITCENEEEAKKLRSLGCRSQALQVVGKMEESTAEMEERRLVKVPEFLAQLGVPDGTRVIMGCQTHRGEEAVLAEAFKRLQPRVPGLFLVLVPQHRERGAEAGRDVRSCGVKCVFRTEITPDRQCQPGEVECLVVNTTGELSYFQQSAGVVFLGGSLRAQGGHNPLDAALMAKPIVFGPSMEDYERISRELLAHQGAFQVVDVSELEATLARLLNDEDFARESGQTALRVAKEHLAPVERIMEMVFQHLKEKNIYTVQV